MGRQQKNSVESYYLRAFFASRARKLKQVCNSLCCAPSIDISVNSVVWGFRDKEKNHRERNYRSLSKMTPNAFLNLVNIVKPKNTCIHCP